MSLDPAEAPVSIAPAGPTPIPIPTTNSAAASVAEVARVGAEIVAAVETVIDGKGPAIQTALTVLLAGGHLLVEDVPGVGKTVLARALARTVAATVSRVQFTPDLLPSDITGVSVWDRGRGEFQFKPGPVFANIVIADEINRASPKTQSALLEAMAERQVSVDGASYRLSDPFVVVATQNPIDMEGTYALPEAQRDRFMARISMGYPDADSEVRMLHDRADADPLDRLVPVVSLEVFRRLAAAVRAVFASEAVERYAVAITAATRADAGLRLGASPRATLQLLDAARARAALDGRDFVLPDDLDALAVSVLAHRLLPARGVSGAELSRLVGRIVREVPVPLRSGG